MKTVRASLVGFGLGVVSLFILGTIWNPVGGASILRNPSPATQPSTPQALAGTSQAMALTEDVIDHTFSIVAWDPETGEMGVAVTTRNACVGNRVPWVRAGVGAVATQASTRPEYGKELLDLMAAGQSPQEALQAALAADPGADRRQVGVIGPSGATAQHTGSGPGSWAGERTGRNFATQGNVLTGPEVLDEVVRVMEETDGSGRALADRLVAALAAGHAAGGDKRKGRRQSAAVIIADPRPGYATRPDGQSVFLNVCEHPEPVSELRRQFDAVSQTLGYRTLEEFVGSDIWQLRVMLHALGFFGDDQKALPRTEGWNVFSSDLALAVDRFRESRGLSTPEDGSPSGLVDPATVNELWRALEEAGRDVEIRKALRDATGIRN